jgi:hypothetical protein
LISRADGFYEVVISPSGSDAEIVALLDALEEYLTDQATGPIRLELEGRHYVMDPDGRGV